MNITIFKYRIFKVKSLMHLFLSQPRRWQIIRIQMYILKLIPDIRLKPCPLCTLDFKPYSTSKYTHFWKTNLPIKFNLPFSAIGGSFTTFGRVVITLAISTTHLIQWYQLFLVHTMYLSMSTFIYSESRHGSCGPFLLIRTF